MCTDVRVYNMYMYLCMYVSMYVCVQWSIGAEKERIDKFRHEAELIHEMGHHLFVSCVYLF